jgi:hypothetical protein
MGKFNLGKFILENVLYMNLKDDAFIWWNSYGLNYEEIKSLSDEECEKLYLDRWSHSKKKYNEIHRGLFLCGNSILQVHGCILKEKVIVSIIPSWKYNLINIHLANRLQVLAKHIQSTRVEDETIQIFKDLNLTMDKYVLHSYFYLIGMDYVDVILGYPWIGINWYN